MSLNETPSAQRIHIGFFGCINSGKSSLVNAVTNQNLSVVSDVKGTTTDPVFKAMELLPLGPVSIVDTAGFDDDGKLGSLRIDKTKEVLNRIDIAVLVVDVTKNLSSFDNELINIFKEKNIKYIIAYNKSDLLKEEKQPDKNEIYVSALKNVNIDNLKELIASAFKNEVQEKPLVKDLINQNDSVILVTPIDSSAPKGRLILPQQQVIRDLLEANAIITVIRETEIKSAFSNFKNKPKLVITDSQVFKKVAQDIPQDVLLTSFSILMARYKGVLNYAVKSVKKIESLKDNDIVLISEGCTHHRQCEDIGSVKIPNWLKKYTNKTLNFEFSSGYTFPTDLSKYALVIHCGACTLKEQEVLNRYVIAEKQNIPITNYGITIAYLNGILARSVQIFPELYNELIYK